MPDVVLSRYLITGLLGEGGMGKVYAAVDQRLGRKVALKFCVESSAGEDAKRRMEHEARSASSLNHPNIATIYDYEEDEDGRPFIVMELVEGQTLSQVIANGPLPASEVLRIGREVARALETAHSRGMLHRDIKPSNICVTPEGGVKVLDFGLARSLSPNQPDKTHSSMVRGTPAYMSPEQARGLNLDGRSDLFALGAVLYECLTGERVFGAPTKEASLVKVIEYDPPPPSSLCAVPASLDQAIVRLLEKDPSKRIPSATVLLQTLEDPSPAETRTLNHLPPPKTNWTRRAILATGCLLAVATIWWAIGRQRQAELPAGARHFLEDGERAIQDGSYWRASKLLEEAVKSAPKYPLARARLAEALMELGDVQRARQQILLAAPPGSNLNSLPKQERLIVTGIHHAVAGDHQASLQEYRSLVESLPRGKRAAALCDLGRALERAQQPGEAEKAYRQALEEDPAAASAQTLLARIAVRRGDAAGAAQRLNEAERLYKAASNLEGIAEVYILQAILGIRLSQHSEASRWIERALETAQATGNAQQSASALLQRVNLEIAQGDVKSAQHSAEQAVRLARQSGASVLATRALMSLGGSFLAKRLLDPAEDYYKEALAAARQDQDIRSEARANANLGSVYQLKGDHAKALSHLEVALDYYRRSQDTDASQRVLLMIARCRSGMGDLQQARQSFEELASTSRANRNPQTEALAEDGLASVLFRLGIFRNALSHHESASQLFAGTGNRADEAYSLMGQARCYGALGQFDQARLLWKRARRAGETLNNPGLTTAARFGELELELAAGNSPQALRLFEALSQDPEIRKTPEDVETLSALSPQVDAMRGQMAKALARCSQLFREQANSTGSNGIASLVLPCAQIYFFAGSPARAAELVRAHRETLEKQGQREVLWRVWALLAAADPSEKENARKAIGLFDELLAPEDKATYWKIPAAARLRRQVF